MFKRDKNNIKDNEGEGIVNCTYICNA